MELTTSDDLDTTLDQILKEYRLNLLRLYFRLFFLSLLFLGVIFLGALLMKFSKGNSFYLICTISTTMGLVLYYYIKMKECIEEINEIFKELFNYILTKYSIWLNPYFVEKSIHLEYEEREVSYPLKTIFLYFFGDFIFNNREPKDNIHNGYILRYEIKELFISKNYYLYNKITLSLFDKSSRIYHEKRYYYMLITFTLTKVSYNSFIVIYNKNYLKNKEIVLNKIFRDIVIGIISKEKNEFTEKLNDNVRDYIFHAFEKTNLVKISELGFKLVPTNFENINLIHYPCEFSSENLNSLNNLIDYFYNKNKFHYSIIIICNNLAFIFIDRISLINSELDISLDEIFSNKFTLGEIPFSMSISKLKGKLLEKVKIIKENSKYVINFFEELDDFK